MAEFAARIGRVRMKNGGADIRIIEGSPMQDGRVDTRGDLYQAARQIAESAEDLAAFLIVGIEYDATDYTAAFVADDCPIPVTLMPSFIAELVRTSVLAKPVARDVFRSMFNVNGDEE